jgi:hypothetical protein
MKRAALTHPKMYDLAAGLECSHPEAIGFLNLLFDFTASNAPRGDIGKFADGAIARGCMYPGDPRKFIECLVAAGWLDSDPTHRLLVHDWPENCEQWVKLKVQKLWTGFATPSGESPATPTPESIANGSATDSADATAIDSAIVSASRASSPLPSSLYPNPISTAAEPAANGKRFIKPTAEEVQAYCDERRNGIRGQEFVDSYEQCGWIVGKKRAPMKDWKAAVRTWEHNRKTVQFSNGQHMQKSIGDQLAEMVTSANRN